MKHLSPYDYLRSPAPLARMIDADAAPVRHDPVRRPIDIRYPFRLDEPREEKSFSYVKYFRGERIQDPASPKVVSLSEEMSKFFNWPITVPVIDSMVPNFAEITREEVLDRSKSVMVRDIDFGGIERVRYFERKKSELAEITEYPLPFDCHNLKFRW